MMRWWQRSKDVEPEQKMEKTSPEQMVDMVQLQKNYDILIVFLQRSIQLHEEAAKALKSFDDPLLTMAARYLESEVRTMRERLSIR